MEVEVFNKDNSQPKQDFIHFAKEILAMYSSSDLGFIYDKLVQYKQKLKLVEYPKIQLTTRDSQDLILVKFSQENNDALEIRK